MRGGKAVGEAVNADQAIRFGLGVDFRVLVGTPNGIQHEAHDHGIGGSEHADLPADNVVVNPAAGGGPEAIQNKQKGKRPQSEGQNHDEIVECRQHGDVLRFRRVSLAAG